MTEQQNETPVTANDTVTDEYAGMILGRVRAAKNREACRENIAKASQALGEANTLRSTQGAQIEVMQAFPDKFTPAQINEIMAGQLRSRHNVEVDASEGLNAVLGALHKSILAIVKIKNPHVKLKLVRELFNVCESIVPAATNNNR